MTYGASRRISVSEQSGGEKYSSLGLLIVNADDWGRNRETTERILECVRQGMVSSVSAMVFMEDSEQGACIAREKNIDAGLHLNLTTPFSAPNVSARLKENQQRLSRYLLRHRFSKVVFHPALAGCFRYVVDAQLEEYQRLYGTRPERIDGHHHMHLAANVIFGGLLPPGVAVRRNFSFQAEEKGRWNRFYRRRIDGVLAKRHPITDYFFALAPLDQPSRLQRIFSLAGEHTVEVETHPVEPAEYRFLMEGQILRWSGGRPLATRFGGSRKVSGN
jgi:predicted glycoside hydrolase/deacetylase ChbG (UPF0249 family)